MMNQERRNFWQGVLLVFGVYFYFLIFAQFGFLELVRRSGLEGSRLKLIMGVMAAGGLIGSIFVPLLSSRISLASQLRMGLAGCACTIFVIWLPASSYLLISAWIGLSLGIATVALASSLPNIFPKWWALGASLGTGLAYAAANLPPVFQSDPKHQALVAGLVCVASFFAVPSSIERFASESAPASSKYALIAYGTILFGALVWLDSAAFYIIQHSALKEHTWSDSSALWRNAAVHFSAALATGFLLPRTGIFRLLGLAFALLGVSALGANQPESRLVAAWTYPAGVSIYSACLVCFPAFGAGSRGSRGAAWTAALLYALGGWICSGLGIGMAENLDRVPWQFVAAATALLAAPLLAPHFLRLKRELAYASLVLVSALIWTGLRRPRTTTEETSLVADGRDVYLAEGCINCHSQFVKPGRDEILWGPARAIEAFRNETPPLFGNRRQGPDLMNIGNRRSAAWLKLHFMAPQDLTPGSSMPSYKHLFEDRRGKALVAYLLSLQSPEPRWATIGGWTAPRGASPSPDGPALFAHHCASCHDQTADKSALHQAGFRKLPPDLAKGPFLFAPNALPAVARLQQLARIIKFGLPGTDMPGHECLKDEDVIALAHYVEQCSIRK